MCADVSVKSPRVLHIVSFLFVVFCSGSVLLLTTLHIRFSSLMPLASGLELFMFTIIDLAVCCHTSNYMNH